MGKKDYYIILGVPATESDAGIRKAFRQLAKAYHPDRAGADSTRHFQDITEAYEVLSDPERRREYNKKIGFKPGRHLQEPQATIIEYGAAPEPLIPQPASLIKDFQTIYPSLNEMLDRILRNFTGRAVPKSEHLEAMTVEVVLTSEEAARGGTFPLAVPAFYSCPMCGGSGRDRLFPCSYCEGHGIIEEEKTIRIKIPPQVRDMTMIEMPLIGLGIHNFHLRLYVRIDMQS